MTAHSNHGYSWISIDGGKPRIGAWHKDFPHFCFIVAEFEPIAPDRVVMLSEVFDLPAGVPPEDCMRAK